MPVILFFGNGCISEFPAGVDAQKLDDGFGHVLGHGPQPPAIESMAAFRATEVAIAQVYRQGALVAVIAGDRSTA